MIAATRLRRGLAPGSGSMVAEALPTRRQVGAAGLVLLQDHNTVDPTDHSIRVGGYTEPEAAIRSGLLYGMLTLVREFVYLSDRMLRQFAPSHESWWNRIKLKKLAGSIGTSGAKFEFESAASTGALPLGDLTKVVSYIQESALWYADSSVHPGRWIFFDAPITYWTLDSVANTGSTMFFDIVPQGHRVGRRRLFLHGATDHLIGSSTRETIAPLTLQPFKPILVRRLRRGHLGS